MRPRSRPAAFVALVILVASVGCAGTPRPADPAALAASAASGRVTPPRMVSRAPAEIRGEVDLRIEVLVDAAGRPDLRTLQVTGRGLGTQRSAIEQWIAGSTFEPAKRDGQPVAAVYRTGIRSRVTVQRM